MYHKQNLTLAEKFKACLDLSDFTFRIMQKMLSRKEFTRRLENIRKDHLEGHLAWLNNLGKRN
jgi:hypothetical protein